MIAELIIGIAALALCKHRKTADGVGRLPKRRIFAEIADAQRNGINFALPYDSANADTLRRMVNRYGFRASARSPRSTEEQYFNQLRRSYNAVSGIGATNLPYTESEVHNENGDVIVVYRDYGTKDQQLQAAIDLIDSMPLNNTNAAMWRALAYIAGGGKLVWKSKTSSGGQLISRGVDDVLNKSEQERKARISYLGSEKKNALSLDQLAHSMWESTGMQYDIATIYDGVEQAVLTCDSRAQAIKYILEMYYNAHKLQDYPDNDVPF